MPRRYGQRVKSAGEPLSSSNRPQPLLLIPWWHNKRRTASPNPAYRQAQSYAVLAYLAFPSPLERSSRCMSVRYLEGRASPVATQTPCKPLPYRIHWQQKDGRCKQRWDNAPYHRAISTFPFHRHLGAADHIESSEPMTILMVLAFLAWAWVRVGGSIQVDVRDFALSKRASSPDVGPTHAGSPSAPRRAAHAPCNRAGHG